MQSFAIFFYAVWHSGLTTEQSNELERVQKRCLRIIYPQLSYNDALFVSGLERLDLRREKITQNLFTDMQHPTHILHGLLPLKRNNEFNIRDRYLYELPLARTRRYATSFLTLLYS